MDKEIDEHVLLGILRLIAPGTSLRTAIDDIAKAKLGALIVISDSPEVMNLINGGFDVNCKFSSQKLVELCKMDGAIVLDGDIKNILYANALLVPDYHIPSNETGTRHKAAERTAKQTNQLVIAVSERKGNITLYKGDARYALQPISNVLQRAVETLRMIEKHKEIFNELILNLNVLEFTGFATLNDVALILQRLEIISRIEEIIRKYILELGNEGSLVKINLKEVRKGLDNEELLILKDYSKTDAVTAKLALFELTLEDLIEVSNVVKAIGYQGDEDKIITKGFRILNKTSLSNNDIDLLINKFENLQKILEAQDVTSILGQEKSEIFQKEVSKFKEQVFLGKKI